MLFLMSLFFIAVLSIALIKTLYVVSIEGFFWGNIWVLILYGFFWAWISNELNMGEVTFLITFLSSFIVLYSWAKQSKTTESMLLMAGYDADRVRYIAMFNFRAIRIYICGLFLYICSFVSGFLLINII
ncbi:hypothetical protein [Photobacterium kishitanii]|nr:hypothetical protein [Photobacterium kishitanii]CEO41010.1 membrane hypothetical protein [Photobacterium kishitanii]